MSSDIFEIIFPSFAFFVGFFLVYTMLEMVVALSLNIVIFHYWGFYVGTADLPRLRRNRRMELIVGLFLAALMIALVCYSRVFDVLLASRIEIRVFALEVFLGMVLIYLVTTEELIDDDLVKKAHKYLYFTMSVVAFVAVILFANRYYNDYKNYIHANLVIPLTQGHTLYVDSEERQKLLTEFRQMIYKNQCPEADFSSYYRSGEPISFFYIVTQPDLRIAPNPMLSSDLKAHTSGRLCNNGSRSFLLTDHGQWYWVVIGNLIAKN
jgi:hypothetical protein